MTPFQRSCVSLGPGGCWEVIPLTFQHDGRNSFPTPLAGGLRVSSKMLVRLFLYGNAVIGPFGEFPYLVPKQSHPYLAGICLVGTATLLDPAKKSTAGPNFKVCHVSHLHAVRNVYVGESRLPNMVTSNTGGEICFFAYSVRSREVA